MRIEGHIEGKDIVLIGGYDGDLEIPRAYQKPDTIYVRVNNHWQRQGGEGNIIYQNCAHDTRDWTSYPKKPGYAVLDRSGGHFGEDIKHCMNNRIPVYAFVREDQDMNHWYCKLNHRMQSLQRSQPTMGTMAIHHLLNYDIKSLYVCGMDLWHSVPRKQWKLGACAHNPWVNAGVILETAVRDGRLDMSEGMVRAVKSLAEGNNSDPLPEWKESMDDNCDERSEKKIAERMGLTSLRTESSDIEPEKAQP